MDNSEKMTVRKSLTEREYEILLLMCDGKSNQEIAKQLHLSYGTVKWYASKIYRKMNVHNRAQVVSRAYELNLVEGVDESQNAVDMPIDNRAYEQKIRIMSSFDGTKIAYAVSGEGSPFIEVAHFMSHLEYEWKSPVYRHLLREFMRNHMLIRYDQRGTGLSDWNVEDQSFEAWVRDVEALVEVTRVKRFPLFGKSMAGTVALAYAARHPEKVSHLILLGTYARGAGHREQTLELEEKIQMWRTMVKIGWNEINPAFRHFFAVREFPNGPIELVSEMEKLIQVSSDADAVLRIGKSTMDIDIRDLAQQIKVPTLIFHGVDDQVTAFEEGRMLAALIPDAQFVPLDTMNHLLVEGEPAWLKFQKTLRRFLES